MKYVLPFLCIICFVFLPAKSESDNGSKRRFISIGTAPAGGAFFVVGSAIAEVVDNAPETNWEVTAESTKGTQENIRRLVNNELEFGTCQCRDLLLRCAW